MSAPAKFGAVVAWLTVAVWAWQHGKTNGASLLVIAGLWVLIAWLWNRDVQAVRRARARRRHGI